MYRIVSINIYPLQLIIFDIKKIVEWSLIIFIVGSYNIIQYVCMYVCMYYSC